MEAKIIQFPIKSIGNKFFNLEYTFSFVLNFNVKVQNDQRTNLKIKIKLISFQTDYMPKALK